MNGLKITIFELITIGRINFRLLCEFLSTLAPTLSNDPCPRGKPRGDADYQLLLLFVRFRRKARLYLKPSEDLKFQLADNPPTLLPRTHSRLVCELHP